MFQQTHSEWQNVFYLTACIYVVGTLCYCLLADGRLQDWAIQAVIEDEHKALYVEKKDISHNEDLTVKDVEP